MRLYSLDVLLYLKEGGAIKSPFTRGEARFGVSVDEWHVPWVLGECAARRKACAPWRSTIARLTKHPYLLNSTMALDKTFDEFYAEINEGGQISERLGKHEGLEEQVKDSLRKMYAQAQTDGEVRRRIKEEPQEFVTDFVMKEMSEYELPEEALAAVAGGAPDTETSLAYDIGYAIGSAAEWIADQF